MDEQNNTTLPKVLIAIGALFLLSQIFSFSLWPLFVLVPGLPFLYIALTGESKDSAGFIFPGLIIAGTGLILLYQSITDNWESWAYIWTLYPVLVGIGLQFHGDRTGSKGEVTTGQGMIRYGLIAFATFAFFFEFLIFGIGGMLSWLWPLLFIGGGAYLLLRDNDNLKDRARHLTVPEKAKPKPKHDGPSAEISPELRRKIDEALAEDKDISAAANGKKHED